FRCVVCLYRGRKLRRGASKLERQSGARSAMVSWKLAAFLVSLRTGNRFCEPLSHLDGSDGLPEFAHLAAVSHRWRCRPGFQIQVLALVGAAGDRSHILGWSRSDVAACDTCASVRA